MSLQNALEELVKEKEVLSKKADSMAAELEDLQNLIADINLSIKTLQKIIETHRPVDGSEPGEPKDKEPEPDDEEIRRRIREAEEDKTQKEKFPPPPKKEFETKKPGTVLNDTFRCDICHCNFQDETALNDHNTEFHGAKPKGQSPWRLRQGKPVCLYCKGRGRKKSFDTMENLEAHIALKHPEHMEAFQKHVEARTPAEV